mmetsp:Transcript_18174/g.21778  ORF Transcript_18174/g.21778 Transcript_18174/m.21778 type:complete len:212 (+) Transcript_18174:284-919(+)|eukprot:CAMPEP_0197845082 /NCGR_PEP_ID=MMETSP1438-20131217/2035_1 /TAXON_ID=1461541 /ORGANISM="Pterosperma sp., Strain CCMP1384" /LENGTH=211 /DNA_ID=CAMNT_0043456189 /DNA_START=277 /DNA_END=912 /DNA_ORIENTATION=+
MLSAALRYSTLVTLLCSVGVWAAELVSEMPSQPAQRSGAASAVVDHDTLLLFGGLLATGEATNDLWEYKIEKDLWTRLHTGEGYAPDARIGHTIVYRKEQVVLFGGYNSSKGDMNDLWSFHRQAENWTELLPEGGKPSQRNGHNAFAPGINSTYMLVFGGNLKNDQWKYDFDENAWHRMKNDTLQNGVPTLSTAFPILVILGTHLLANFAL